jgi:hypothetical protein
METTLNIRMDILEKIVCAAESKEMTCSEVIVFLLKQVMGGIGKTRPIGRPVKYQERRRPEDWTVLHVQVREDEYEYMMDLRRLLKLSVSLIVARAVEKYLNDSTTCVVTDNYRFVNYMLIQEIIDHVKCWRLIWGYPPHVEKFYSS